MAMRLFWFGKAFPTAFATPVVRGHLSFNGQLHFQCRSCNEIIWGDVVFAKLLLESGTAFPCPNCRQQCLEVVQFRAIESRICTTCAEQSFALPEDEFECAVCHGRGFASDETIIHPPYPKRLFALYGREIPFGQSAKEDIDFLMEYVRSLRMAPEFHLTCIHLVAFIESIFEHLYGSSASANDLLNAASGLMRTVYRETGNPDAGYLSIALMIEARNLTTDPIQRAVFGFNISQNVYSVIAREHDSILALRLGFDLKEYGIWLSRRTLVAFEAIGEEWLAQLKARQKWLLGDLLKASSPSEAQIAEALQWFAAALEDPALPNEVVDFVRESAYFAQAKRNNLTSDERQRLDAELGEIARRNLDQSAGLQRIQSLVDLLRGKARAGQNKRRREFALRCLGEALVYTATNDPESMLRHAGSILSRLVAGFAADAFAAGTPLDGIAAVELFRSMAIEHSNIVTSARRDLHGLDFKLNLKTLFGGRSEDPAVLAENMLSQHRESLEANIREALADAVGRRIIWYEVWAETMFMAEIKLHDTMPVIRTETSDFLFDGTRKALELPMADAPPGRLRSRQVQSALASGWTLFASLFKDQPIDRGSIIVGTSIIGSWPVDAAEAMQPNNAGSIRPTTFAPTISVASAACKSARGRPIERVLLLSYSGEDLTGIEQEIDSIRAAYGARLTVLSGDGDVKVKVMAALSAPYDVVHFCGHGSFDYLQPMRSQICFRNDRDSNGVVTAADILQCGSIGRHPIVVLSACTSALVLPNGSNNFLGLAGAFIRTGATSIVGARWPISDAVAAAFSKHFHARLAAGYPVAQAVSFAKTLLRNERLDEWSAFMVIGA